MDGASHPSRKVVSVCRGPRSSASAARCINTRRAAPKYTPCRTDVIQEQEETLAVVRAEPILIHPFREGNGRCARILSTLKALQTDLPPLDFSGIQGA